MFWNGKKINFIIQNYKKCRGEPCVHPDDNNFLMIIIPFKNN